MELTQFIGTLQQHGVPSHITTLAFHASMEYPLLCMSALLEYLKKQPSTQIQTLDLQQKSAELFSRLSSSFLGMRMNYWLGNLDMLDAKVAKQWHDFIKEYEGPHCLIFFSKQDLECKKNSMVITIPEIIEKPRAMLLFNLLNGTAPARNKQMLDALYAHTEKVTVEQIYLLARYAQLVGTSQPEFIKGWLDQLVLPETSLFTLSTHFFAKDSRKFFELWSEIGQEYAPAFWIVYWSEQLFRAYHFVEFMNQRSPVEAKKIAYRLPFSFMQRDWKKYKAEQLRQAHDQLYDIDYRLKNGGSDVALDLFYATFLTKNQ